MSTQLTTERLREVAASPIDNELRAMAAELLAKREEFEALAYRAEDAESQLRCVTLTGDAVASDSSLYRGNSVRYWWEKCQAYKDSAGKLYESRQKCEALEKELDASREACERKHQDGWAWQQLSQQREAERDAVTRHRDDLLYLYKRDCETMAATGIKETLLQDAIPALAAERDAARAEAEKLRAELDAVKRQREQWAKWIARQTNPRDGACAQCFNDAKPGFVCTFHEAKALANGGA